MQETNSLPRIRSSFEHWALGPGHQLSHAKPLVKLHRSVTVISCLYGTILMSNMVLRCRLRVRGSRSGQVSVFADNLPGMPANIRPSRSGGYWVALAMIRQPDFSIIDYGAERPWLREFLVKVHLRVTPRNAPYIFYNNSMVCLQTSATLY